MDSRFRPSPEQARELVSTFGTLLYVIDEASFRDRIRRYRNALASCSGATQLCYASKANSALAILAIAHQEGCLIDVASEGEFRAALSAGIPAEQCNFHGNAKTEAELRFALERGIGEIIVDNLEEIALLARLQSEGLRAKALVLRLAPGVDPKTHEKISTGQEDSKFGLNIADGSAETGVRALVEAGLPLVGFHAHVGSQLLDPEAQCVSGERIAQFAIDMRDRHGVQTKILNVGGGLGALYVAGNEPLPIEEYVAMIDARVSSILRESGMDPVVMHEPGRALICEAGATLYTVHHLKPVTMDTGGIKTYVAVDGGLSDNPRPGLYGAAYTVERVLPNDATAALATFTVSGKHCETDTLFPHVQLPKDLAPGDVLRVLSTGAYNSSMSSNYNRYPRPSTALIRLDGNAVLIQRRDSWDEMIAREHLPHDL